VPPTRKDGRPRMVRSHAINGIVPEPGGLIHFRKTIEMTAAMLPFTATRTQNQSIAGKRSQCCLASGRGWPLLKIGVGYFLPAATQLGRMVGRASSRADLWATA
jgi:hypothetical protein